MSVVNRAIWAVERRLADPLSLETIAGACGVSASHLAHAFSAATGHSLIAYARARRLSLAAEALAYGAGDILAVALDAGYASHEAFTRAFKEAFGRTPEAVRASGSTAGLALTAPAPYVAAPANLAASPLRFVRLPQRVAVGLVEKRRTGEVATIPLQWGQFTQRYDEIDHKAEARPWGVSFGRDDGFDYACAVIVSRIDRLPGGLSRVDLPACDYAVYEHSGHVSRIAETYAAISSAAPEAKRPLAGPVLEQHGPEFDPRTGLGGVFIYMPAFA